MQGERGEGAGRNELSINLPAPPEPKLEKPERRFNAASDGVESARTAHGIDRAGRRQPTAGENVRNGANEHKLTKLHD